jgi:hypothetical protein
MTTPICTDTLVGILLIALVLLMAFPFWPSLVVAFEAGLLVGVFLHSAHTANTPSLGTVLDSIVKDDDINTSTSNYVTDGGSNEIDNK